MKKRVLFIGIVCLIFVMFLNLKALAVTTNIDSEWIFVTMPDGFEKRNVKLLVDYKEYENYTNSDIDVEIFVFDRTEDKDYYSQEYLDLFEETFGVLSDGEKDPNAEIFKNELAILGGAKGFVNVYRSFSTYICQYFLQTENYNYNITIHSKNLDEINGSVVNELLDSFSAKEAKTIYGFNDVTEKDWFGSSVKYVVDNNILKGYSNKVFAPNDNLTRGMLATLLYRMEGAPNVTGTPKFPDVQDSSKFYYKAIKWATDNNVVAGYNNGNFGPEDNITREQLAVILNRYAKYKNKDVSKTDDLKKFSDTNSISDYALSSIKWAVGAGVITGNADGTINPLGNATRAEVSAMMVKYCNRVGR